MGRMGLCLPPACNSSDCCCSLCRMLQLPCQQAQLTDTLSSLHPSVVALAALRSTWVDKASPHANAAAPSEAEAADAATRRAAGWCSVPATAAVADASVGQSPQRSASRPALHPDRRHRRRLTQNP